MLALAHAEHVTGRRNGSYSFLINPRARAVSRAKYPVCTPTAIGGKNMCVLLRNFQCNVLGLPVSPATKKYEL